MKKFLINIIVVILLFLMGLLGIYSSLDPFKVVKNYENYSDSLFIINRDFVSTETYLKNYKKEQYNSFILGSSRAMGFDPEDWAKKIKTDSDVIPFSFSAFEETIEGIYQKLVFLNEKKADINNVLILLCRDVSFEDLNEKGSIVLTKHPATSSNSYMGFHYFYFKNFINPEFMKRYLDYRILGKYKPYMRGYFETKKMEINPINNHLKFPADELEFQTDSLQFVNNRKKTFEYSPTIGVDTANRIKEKHKRCLQQIKKILIANNANFKVVLSPLYEKIKWHQEDMLFLRTLFQENLYDFSGSNNITNNVFNYYESSHYRPSAGNVITSLIYEY